MRWRRRHSKRASSSWQFELSFGSTAFKMADVRAHLISSKSFISAILTAPQVQESEIRAQHIRVAELKTRATEIDVEKWANRSVLHKIKDYAAYSINQLL